MITASTSEHPYWQHHFDIPDIKTFARRLTNKGSNPKVEWLIVANMAEYTNQDKTEQIRNIIRTAAHAGAIQILLI